MRKIVLTALISICLFYSQKSSAETIANCSNPKGHSYYNYQDAVLEKNSGWQKDEITNGLIQLQRTDTGYDIYYLDSTKNMSSVIKDDGGTVSMLYKREDSIDFLVRYPSGSTDIYRFFKEKNGINKFSMISMRTQIPKSSLMVGECSAINFKNIK
jgi:hypothetical protein